MKKELLGATKAARRHGHKSTGKWTFCLYRNEVICVPHNRIPFEAIPIQTYPQTELVRGLSTAEQLYLEKLIKKARRQNDARKRTITTNSPEL